MKTERVWAKETKKSPAGETIEEDKQERGEEVIVQSKQHYVGNEKLGGRKSMN